MKNLENNIRPIYDDVIKDIDKLLTFSGIVGEYATDVDTTVDKLCDMDKSEKGDVFREIAKGLKGELTRDKAIILGKNVITLYMKELITDCLEDLTELYSQPSVSMDIVKVNSDTLDESSDIEVLEDHMNIIKGEQLRLEYLGTKVNKVIVPYLAGDLATQKDVPTFLSVSTATLDSISYNSKIPEAISAYNVHNKTTAVIKKLVKDMINKNITSESEVESMLNQLDANRVELVDFPCEHEYILDIVNKNDTIALDVELYELHMTMHDSLVVKLPEIVKNTKTLDGHVNKINGLDNVSGLLNDYVGIIEGYFKDEMTLEVMTAATKVYSAMIIDSISSLVKLLNVTNDEISDANNKINIINQLYDIDNEIIVSAVLTSR